MWSQWDGEMPGLCFWGLAQHRQTDITPDFSSLRANSWASPISPFPAATSVRSVFVLVSAHLARPTEKHVTLESRCSRCDQTVAGGLVSSFWFHVHIRHKADRQLVSTCPWPDVRIGGVQSAFPGAPKVPADSQLLHPTLHLRPHSLGNGDTSTSHRGRQHLQHWFDSFNLHRLVWS